MGFADKRKLILFAVIIGCFVLINLAGLCLMGIDKRRARLGKWRIPERTLFLIALLGGSIGSLIGMYLFRHKTRHLKFVIGMPLILICQGALLIWIF